MADKWTFGENIPKVLDTATSIVGAVTGASQAKSEADAYASAAEVAKTNSTDTTTLVGGIVFLGLVVALIIYVWKR